MVQVRKAVVLAAGLGTRMLPATKAIPKEMLPVVDKPLIQYAVEEAAAAGIEDVIFVVAEGKEAIAQHFGHTTRTEAAIRGQGDAELLGSQQGAGFLIKFYSTAFEVNGMLALIILLGLIALAVDRLVVEGTRYLTRWAEAGRGVR